MGFKDKNGLGLKVFLSYSSKDKELINLIDRSIKYSSPLIDTYIADRDVQPGEVLVKEIKNSIEECDIFLAIFTKNSVESTYSNQEIGMAIGQKKNVVALVERGVEGSLSMLAEIKYIPFDRSNPSTSISNLQDFLDNKNTNFLNKKISDEKTIRNQSGNSGILIVGLLSITVGILLIYALSGD